MRVQCAFEGCGVELERAPSRLKQNDGRAWCPAHREFARTRPKRERKDKGARRSEWWVGVCDGCGEPLEKPQWAVRKNNYCGRDCFERIGGSVAGRSGGQPRSTDWLDELPELQPETGAAIEKFGGPAGWLFDRRYLVLLWPDHPASSLNGRIGEHRVVAYEHVGDAVIGHHVDHENGDPSDNRWQNLRVLTPAEHGKKTWASEGMGNAWNFVKWLRAEKPDLFEELLIEYRSATTVV